uniref:hypothetical protein n=1 Tax=Trichocoleus desertorum TaxID=1481672 RepID=UPI0025B4394E|nr:hypothetical protein [Trichocoleus desertorum]
MRTLKQTYQELVFYHWQSGRWLAAGGWLVLCLGAIVGTSFKPEIVCPGGTQAPSCILTYHSFTGLSLERDIQLKAARSKPTCNFSRNRKSSCDGFTVILTTDVGDLSFPDRYSAKDRANRFIQNPSKFSFQIQSGLLPVVEYRPFLSMLGCMAIAIILKSVDKSLASEEIYVVRLNKEKDWATVTRKQHSGKPQVAVNEFPVSAIASVNVGQDHLALKLKSG